MTTEKTWFVSASDRYKVSREQKEREEMGFFAVLNTLKLLNALFDAYMYMYMNISRSVDIYADDNDRQNWLHSPLCMCTG